MAGWFELHKSSNGQFNFVLKTENDQIIPRSEQDESKTSAQGRVASVQSNGTSTTVKDQTGAAA